MTSGFKLASDKQWLRQAVSSDHLSVLDRVMTDGKPGARLATLPPLAAPAMAAVKRLIAEHALPGARLVRVVGFAKDEGANWGVGWHQDRIIAVTERHDVAGFAQWSNKSGIWHCEPPIAVLAAMRFVRLHLDDCDAENGAMEIAVGSHGEGVVRQHDADSVAARYRREICVARRGDIQILPMLTLHRSLPARTPHPRRVLRLDFAAADLPSPLAWVGMEP